jgi:Ser/Thr protein kinase RdoA (MazF antagonist)
VTDGAHRRLEQIESELTWLDHLSQHGCSVPTPVRTDHGELVETFEHNGGDYHVALFERLGGNDLWCRAEITSLPEYQRNLGQVLGRLHRASDSVQLPERLRRGQWYEETEILMPAQIPAEFHGPTAEAMYCHQENMRALAATADPRHYGLCHGDVHGGNMLYDQGHIWLLDFELGCYSWRILDFSVLLMCDYLVPIWRMEGASPAAAREFIQNLVAGYREEHDFDSTQLELLPELLGIREIIIYTVTKHDPEKWDQAIPRRHGTTAEFIAWMEDRWSNGRTDYRLNFSGI